MVNDERCVVPPTDKYFVLSIFRRGPVASVRKEEIVEGGDGVWLLSARTETRFLRHENRP